MHDFISHVLQQYFHTTGWTPSNSYLNLTSSSSCILDFPIPNGLSLSISASPSPKFFFNTYTLTALPKLKGSVAYIFTNLDPENTDRNINVGKDSKNVDFREMTTRYRTLPVPRKPEGKDEIWLGGKRIDTRDYLLYGCMHVPTSRLDALFTTRLSPTWQFFATAISLAPKTFPSSSSTSELNHSTSSGLIAGPTNLQMTLQRDTGKWCTEYSYSADDSLWGFRFLHNFGSGGKENSPSFHKDQAVNETLGIKENNILVSNEESSLESESMSSLNGNANITKSEKLERVDDQISSSLDSDHTTVGGGLRGRFSAGAEMFFSAAEKSAGLSTGIRFTTLPDPPNPSSDSTSQQQPSQPPTTITATLNPMMGHLSTAYAARMSRDVVLCSRFDFNMYSYDSELTMGAEYWLRSSTPSATVTSSLSSISNSISDVKHIEPERKPEAQLRKDLNLRERESLTSNLDPSSKSNQVSLSLREVEEKQNLFQSLDIRETQIPSITTSLNPVKESSNIPKTSTPSTTSPSSLSILPQITGVVRARMNSLFDVSLLWEGKLRNCLVSVGVRADLSSRNMPLRGVGMEVMYFSSGEESEMGMRKKKEDSEMGWNEMEFS